MVEFKDEDLTGSRFERVDLSERFHNLAMRDVRITGAWIQDLFIDGAFEGSLLVNDVDVLPYVEVELNRRHPGREAIFAVRTCDADGVREAWAIDEQVWAETVERARRLPEAMLHEQVDGEWSFTDERLDGTTEPVMAPGYPESESFPVRRCLGAIVIDEWEHHLFANRDLAVLEANS